jgi:predicted nucleic acid-binding protein
MTCADTSSVISYMQGEKGSDVDLVDRALADHRLLLAPISLTELLSDPRLPPVFESLVLAIPRLELSPGYWHRTAKLRVLLMRGGYRPKIADSLIAQSCLDHDVPLITRDRDFAAFQKLAGLQLL